MRGHLATRRKQAVYRGEKTLVLQHGRPILIAALNETDTVFIPPFLDTFIIVQVELAIDDSPAARIAFCSLALSYCPGAITAILRGVFGWFGEEEIEIFFAREAELSAFICRRIVSCSFGGFADRKVSDRVIALQSQV